jgi:hypothetical protein
MSETDPQDLHESNPNSSGPQHAAGGMGVSSERTGHAGPGQHTTDGVRDTSADKPAQPDDQPDDQPEAPPEQSPGNEETNAQGIQPKAGYPSLDPRSD